MVAMNAQILLRIVVVWVFLTGELDTIVGKNQQQAIVTLTERRSGLSLLKRVDRSTASQVSKAIITLLKPHEC